MAQRLLHLVLRAAAVFFGGTITAHFLASNGRLAGSGTVPDSYLTWLTDIVRPDGDTISALGTTMVLASVALLIGGTVGGLVGLLVRPRLAGRPIRAAAVPVLALSGLPFVVLATGLANRWAPDLLTQPLDLGAVDGFPLWPVTAAAAIVGLSVAPAFTVMAAHSTTADMAGVDAILASAAARTEPILHWRFGLPTTTFLFSLTAMELFGTRAGALHRFATAVSDDDLTTAMEIVALMVAGAAAVAVLVDLVADLFDRRDTPTDASPLSIRETEVSGAITPLALAWTATIAAGVYGLLASRPTAASTPDRAPDLGGPLLGTDSAGFDLLPALASAIGTALVSAAAPAALAVALGWLLASIQWRIDVTAGRILGAFVDVLWWPLPLMAGIAHLYLGRPDNPAFDASTIALTGLALTPLATRAVGRNLAVRGTPVGLRLVAAWLLVGAAGLGLSMLLGAMDLAGAAPTMGGLIANAAAAPDGSWVQAVVPPLVGVWLLGLLIGLGSALTRPAPALRPAPAALPVQAEPSDQPTDGITIEVEPRPEREREPSMVAAGTVALEPPPDDATVVLSRPRTASPPTETRKPDPVPPDDNHFLVITQPIDRADLGLNDDEAKDEPDDEAADEPAVSEPAANEPAADEPAASDPAPSEPAASENAVSDEAAEAPEPETDPAPSEPETGGYQGARSLFRSRPDAPAPAEGADEGDITIF